MGSERRKTPRIDFHLPVMIKGYKGTNKVMDFSLTGLFIQVEDSSLFTEEDIVWIIMQLPHEKRPMEVKARVARVAGDGIGVEFMDLSPEQTKALENCFDVFRHTIPLPGT
jgi:c-di-GMP-binding flagellar brake protein YcgR